MSPRSRKEYIEVTFLRYKNAPRKRKSAPHRSFLSRESPHHHIRPSGGYPFCGSSRYAVFTKSPQTGIYSESYSGRGGKITLSLSRTGYDAIIFEGKSNHPIFLEISDKNASSQEVAPARGLRFPQAAGKDGRWKAFPAFLSVR